MNVAIGLSRLGRPTAFVGRLSDDPIATVLRQHLQRSAVDLRFVAPAPQPSTVALVELSDGHARYEFSRRGADFQWREPELAFLPGGAAAVHFGSLASWVPPGDAVIAAAISRLRHDGSALISYDPNVRPALLADAAAARRTIEASVRLAHVVKASTDDISWLYGNGIATADAVARHWLDLGADVVVITAGPDGATAWTRHQAPLTRPAYPAELVDTVGAGDAFMSGLLDGLARRDLLSSASVAELADAATLASILDDAALIAGITVSRPGADPPRRAEADAHR
jgi:fructokinase